MKAPQKKGVGSVWCGLRSLDDMLWLNTFFRLLVTKYGQTKTRSTRETKKYNEKKEKKNIYIVDIHIYVSDINGTVHIESQFSLTL